jgi:hypothetical protein
MVNPSSIESLAASLPSIAPQLNWILMAKTRLSDAFSPATASLAQRGFLGCFPFAHHKADELVLRVQPGISLEKSRIAVAWWNQREATSIAPDLKHFVAGRLAQLDVADPDQTLKDSERTSLIELSAQFGDASSAQRVLDATGTVRTISEVRARSAASGSFETGAVFSGSGTTKIDPYGKYNALIAWLSTHRNPNGKYGDWSHLSPADRQQVMAMFKEAGYTGRAFFGGKPGDHIASTGKFGAQIGADNLSKLAEAAVVAANPSVFTTNAFIAPATGSLMHWNAVKQWELAQEYGLEGNQQLVGDYGATTRTWKGRGEIHGWPYQGPASSIWRHTYSIRPTRTRAARLRASGTRVGARQYRRLVLLHQSVVSAAKDGECGRPPPGWRPGLSKVSDQRRQRPTNRR